MVLPTAAMFRTRRLYGCLFLPLAGAASLATLFVKQHVVADVVGGLLLALAVDWLVQSGRAGGFFAKGFWGHAEWDRLPKRPER